MAHNVSEVHLTLVCRKGDANDLRVAIEGIIADEQNYLPDFLGMQVEIGTMKSKTAVRIGDRELRDLVNDGAE